MNDTSAQISTPRTDIQVIHNRKISKKRYTELVQMISDYYFTPVADQQFITTEVDLVATSSTSSHRRCLSPRTVRLNLA
jgi:hypothetical protein